MRTLSLFVLSLICFALGGRDYISHLAADYHLKQTVHAATFTQDSSLWAALDKQGIHPAAWLTVENSSIDTPVMQGKGEFYLTHGVHDEESSNGIPYLFEGCQPNDVVCIVLGHHIAYTDIAFSELADAWRPEVLAKLGELTWQTRNGGTEVFKPLCAARVPANYAALWDGLGEDTDLASWLKTLYRDSQTQRFSNLGERELNESLEQTERAIVLVTCSETSAHQPWRTLVVFCTSKTEGKQIHLT